MSAEGIAAAREMIKNLRSLNPIAYQKHLAKSINHEANNAMRQAQYYGFETAYAHQMTREDFDITYAALEKGGETDPKAYLAQEASYIRELYTNPDPIGRHYMAQVKSARIKMAPHIAKRMDVSDEECERILHQYSDLSRKPGLNLTDAEREYIAARRLPISYSLKNGIYASSAYDIQTSPWADRVKAEAQSNGSYLGAN